jgi:hypothetical protein
MKMLTRRLSVALAGIIAAVAFSGSVLASTSHFTIFNINDNLAIQQAWFAKTGEYKDAWKPVSLDGPILPTGLGQVTVRNAKTCLFDIKIRFSNGTEHWAKNVDGCSGGAAAFR